MTDTTAADAAFEAYLDAHAGERLESYKDLIRIPSISALHEHAPDCRRAPKPPTKPGHSLQPGARPD